MTLTMKPGFDMYTTTLSDGRVACFRPLPAWLYRWSGRPAQQVECWVEDESDPDNFDLAVPGAVVERAARLLGRKMRYMV
jgi:hypothetical protein